MDVKTLKKYIGSTNWGLRILGGMFLLLGVVYIASSHQDLLLRGLISLALGALILWLAVSSAKSFKAHMRQLEDSGEIARVLEDFSQAQPLVKDSVRMGQHYIFGKKMNQVVRYEDIRQVYQHITRRNFVESDRCLKYVDKNGKVQDLCGLRLRGKSDEDVKKIMIMILTKNPNVKLGYR